MSVTAAAKSPNSKWLAGFALAILWLVVWFLIALGILSTRPDDTDELKTVAIAAAAPVLAATAGIIHRSIKVSLLIVLLILGVVLVWWILTPVK